MKSGFFEQLIFIFIHINKFTQKKNLTSKIQDISVGFWREEPNGSLPSLVSNGLIAEFFFFGRAQIQNSAFRRLIWWNAAFHRRKQTKKVPRGMEPTAVRYACRALGGCRVTRGPTSCLTCIGLRMTLVKSYHFPKQNYVILFAFLWTGIIDFGHVVFNPSWEHTIGIQYY